MTVDSAPMEPPSKPLGGLEVIVSSCNRLHSLLGSQKPWADVAQSLVTLLRRHAAGLAFCTATDEVSNLLRRAKQAPDAPRAVRGVITDVVREDPAPAYWTVEVDAGAGSYTQAIVCEHSAHAQVRVQTDIRVRICSVPLHRDYSRHVPFGPALGLAASTHEKNAVRLLPTMSVVFEIQDSRVTGESPSGDVGFPKDAPELLVRETLQHVWDSRNLSPDWVSGRVVQVARDSLSLSDWQSRPGPQPVVTLRLTESQTDFLNLLDKGDVLLLCCPSVSPTGDAFELGLTDESLVFAMTPQALAKMIARAAEPSQPALTLDEDAVAPPPTKRQCVETEKSTGETIPSSQSTSLQSLASSVQLHDILRISKPENEPPFGMFAVVTSPHDVNSENDEENATRTLRDGLSVRFAGMSSRAHRLALREAVVGSVLWLSGVTLVSSTLIEASEFENMSRLQGTLFSPFLRCLVSCTQLDALCLANPDTVHIQIVLTSVTPDPDDFVVRLVCSDLSANDKTAEADEVVRSSSICVKEGTVFGELFGMPFHDFWYSKVSMLQRTSRSQKLVGSRFLMAVALGTNCDGSPRKVVTAITRLNMLTPLQESVTAENRAQ